MTILNERLADWRHQLHQHPGTAFAETWAADFVAQQLREMHVDVFTGIGCTGVVGVLRVGDGQGAIGLRADMDANALTETGNPPYVSQCPGVMHGCGHDGHIATLLGAAMLLAESRDFNGTACFIFQPAEEIGRGAKAMLQDGLFTRFPIDEIYGLHNFPALPAGTVYTREGGLMSSEDNFTIQIHGRGGHASSPHLNIDPLVIAAQVILGLQTIVSRNADPTDQAVVSCTEIHTDGGHNAIPENVTITGDVRTTMPETQALIKQRMRAICAGICTAGGATCDVRYTHEFRPTVNTKSCVETVAKAARKIVGEAHVQIGGKPWMASEDFGTFLEHVPGCFFLLGSGKHQNPADNIFLHNAAFDYNDDILETGARIFAQIVRDRLPLSL